MSNGYLCISIAEMGLSMMHCILMMKLIRNSHGVCASVWHLEQQELLSKLINDSPPSMEFIYWLYSNLNCQILTCLHLWLRYLHEVCQPPMVHHNFKSANLLLDEKLEVHVSDCGLAPLITSPSVSLIMFSFNTETILVSISN